MADRHGRKVAGGRARSRSANGGGPARNLDGASATVGDTRAPIDLHHLKQHVSLAMVLDRYGVALRKLGHQYSTVCPIHDGSDPRQFVVRLDAGTWFCFGDCDRGGSVLEFVALKERVSIRNAASLLADWFAIDQIPQRPPRVRQQRSTSMNNGQPSHGVYVVENRDEGEGGFWTRVGSAWLHKDGKSGLTVQLKPGIAVSGRIVLLAEDEQRSKPKV